MNAAERAIRNKVILMWLRNDTSHFDHVRDLYQRELKIPLDEIGDRVTWAEDADTLEWLWHRFNWNICASEWGRQHGLKYDPSESPSYTGKWVDSDSGSSDTVRVMTLTVPTATIARITAQTFHRKTGVAVDQPSVQVVELRKGLLFRHCASIMQVKHAFENWMNGELSKDKSENCVFVQKIELE